MQRLSGTVGQGTRPGDILVPMSSGVCIAASTAERVLKGPGVSLLVYVQLILRMMGRGQEGNEGTYLAWQRECRRVRGSLPS